MNRRSFSSSGRIQGDIDQPNQRERVLIQPDGRVWDHFHEVTLRWIGVVAIFGTLALLQQLIFCIGRLRISPGVRGARCRASRLRALLTLAHGGLVRDPRLDRLNVNVRKLLLRPLIGPEAFSTFSEGAKYVHNYNQLFLRGWARADHRDVIKDNIRTGPMSSGSGRAVIHQVAARARAPLQCRRKAGVLGALGAGTLVAISGFLLLFPFYVTNIFGMQIAQGVHAVIAVLFVAMILATSTSVPPAWKARSRPWASARSITTGRKEHHGLWLKEQIAKGRTGHREDLPAATPAE